MKCLNYLCKIETNKQIHWCSMECKGIFLNQYYSRNSAEQWWDK